MFFPYDCHVTRSCGTHMCHIGLRWHPYVKPICAEYKNAICVPDCFATWDMYEIPMWQSCDKVAWHTYVSYWCQMRPMCESYTCPIWESNKCVTLLSDKWHIWDFPYDSYVARPYGTHMGHMGPRWVPCRKPICAAYANAICVSDRLCLAGTK